MNVIKFVKLFTPKPLFVILSVFVIPMLLGCSMGSGSDINEDSMLRSDASFHVQVYNDVYWVPANTLGMPDLTDTDIQDMVGQDPFIIQEQIDTVYEAIRYIEVSGFRSASDNIQILEAPILWEHHKPGYFAVSTNEGCCSTISNLFHFLLEDDYEEIGYIAISQIDGNGHVINYVKQNDLFYVIDLTNYRMDNHNAVIENGDLDDHNSGRGFILANLHETDDLANIEKYYSAYVPLENRFVLWESFILENVPPLGINITGYPAISTISILFPDTVESIINIFYDDPDDSITLTFSSPPDSYPAEWEPYNAVFSVNDSISKSKRNKYIQNE